MYVFLVVTRKQQVYCRRLTRDYSIPTQTVMEEQEKIMNSDKVSSTASEGRKNSKPIMEKRRRARINASLAELKSLLLEVMKSEGTRQNKMEKADILELTVRHLRQLQHQQFSALTSTDPAVINKYRLGFNECASEVSKFLGNMNGLDADIRARLLNHLANCTINPDSERSKNIQSPNVKDEQRNPTSPLRCPPSFDGVRIRNDSGTPIVINQELIYGPNNNLQQAIIRPKSNDTQQSITKIDDKPTHPNTTINSPLKNVHVPSSNGNEIEASTQPLQIAKVFGGFQAIPTKMPSGEMAFIIPAANMMSCNNFPNYVIPVIQPQSSVQINNQQTTLGQTLQHVSPVQVTYSVNNVAAPLPAQPMLSSMAGNIAAQPVLSTGFVGNITSHPTVTFQHQSPILINQFSSAEKINTTSQLSLPSLVSSAFSSIKDISVNRERTSPEQNSPVDASHRSVSSTGASSTFTLPNECNKLDPMWRPW